MKYEKFSDIPQFTTMGSYRANIPWGHLEQWIKENQEEMGLQMVPVFQRGHVWTEDQQIAYVEYILRGGTSGRDIFFNCSCWNRQTQTTYTDFVCVDGLQRMTAVLNFLNNRIPAFGSYYCEYKDKCREPDFIVHVNDLQTEKEVLQWYVEMNSGGTPHSEQEIQKVRQMIEDIEAKT